MVEQEKINAEVISVQLTMRTEVLILQKLLQ